jgi:2-methylcitrate dehydratase PrpD
VAVAIAKRTTDITAFYPENLADPQVRELAQRVEVLADSEMNLRRYDYPASHVAVALKDGRLLRESTTAVHGDARNPASFDELADKFIFLAGDILGAEGTQKVIETVQMVDALNDIRELTALLGKVA